MSLYLSDENRSNYRFISWSGDPIKKISLINHLGHDTNRLQKTPCLYLFPLLRYSRWKKIVPIIDYWPIRWSDQKNSSIDDHAGHDTNPLQKTPGLYLFPLLRLQGIVPIIQVIRSKYFSSINHLGYDTNPLQKTPCLDLLPLSRYSHWRISVPIIDLLADQEIWSKYFSSINYLGYDTNPLQKTPCLDLLPLSRYSVGEYRSNYRFIGRSGDPIKIFFVDINNLKW